MTAARDIVCFGLAEWDSLLPTNQHHLCRRLAGGRRVLFVDTVGTRKPRLAPADLVRLVRRLWRGRRPLREVEPNIWRLSALGPAPGLGGWRREWLRRAFARALGGALERLGWRQPVLWFFNARAGFVLGPPAARAFPGGVGPAVYHAVDDLRQVAGADAEEIERAEAFLAARAARVIASAPPLFERLRRLAPDRALHWPNVADFERFHRAADPAAEIPRAITALPRPRIVFAGHLTPSKLDVPLLDRAIERRPLWQWIFIGPVWEGADSEAIDLRDCICRLRWHRVAAGAMVPGPVLLHHCRRFIWIPVVQRSSRRTVHG